jgi:hypothetical protein
MGEEGAISLAIPDREPQRWEPMLQFCGPAKERVRRLQEIRHDQPEVRETGAPKDRASQSERSAEAADLSGTERRA